MIEGQGHLNAIDTQTRLEKAALSVGHPNAQSGAETPSQLAYLVLRDKSAMRQATCGLPVACWMLLTAAAALGLHRRGDRGSWWLKLAPSQTNA